MMRNRSVPAFFLSWALGVGTGALFAAVADPSLFSLMRQALDNRVSIVPLLLAAVFPFLIAAYAVFINRYWILYTVSLLKGFAFSFCGCLISRAFGTAAWLVQPMLQFTDTALSGVFCWFCIRRCCAGGDIRKDLIICAMITAAVVIADYLSVSEFLSGLI